MGITFLNRVRRENHLKNPFCLVYPLLAHSAGKIRFRSYWQGLPRPQMAYSDPIFGIAAMSYRHLALEKIGGVKGRPKTTIQTCSQTNLDWTFLQFSSSRGGHRRYPKSLLC